MVLCHRRASAVGVCVLAGLFAVLLLLLVPGRAEAQTFDLSGFVKSSYYYDPR